VDGDNRLKGLVHIHDALRAGVAGERVSPRGRPRTLARVAPPAWAGRDDLGNHTLRGRLLMVTWMNSNTGAYECEIRRTAPPGEPVHTELLETAYPFEWACTIDPTGRFAAWVTRERMVVLFDAVEGERETIHDLGEARPGWLKFTSDGEKLLLVGEEGRDAELSGWATGSREMEFTRNLTRPAGRVALTSSRWVFLGREWNYAIDPAPGESDRIMTGDEESPGPGFARAIPGTRLVSRDLESEPTAEIELQVEAERIPFDFRRNLIGWAKEFDPDTKWTPTPFEENFRDLNDLTEYIQGSSLANLRRQLTAEAERTGEDFEVLGLKISARVVTGVGAWLLFGIQLYFFLHLSALLNRKPPREDKVWTVPWIGLYSGDGLGRAVVELTVLWLPVVVCVFLIYRRGSWLSWTLVGALLVAALSYVVFARLEQLTDFRRGRRCRIIARRWRMPGANIVRLFTRARE